MLTCFTCFFSISFPGLLRCHKGVRITAEKTKVAWIFSANTTASHDRTQPQAYPNHTRIRGHRIKCAFSTNSSRLFSELSTLLDGPHLRQFPPFVNVSRVTLYINVVASFYITSFCYHPQRFSFSNFHKEKSERENLDRGFLGIRSSAIDAIGDT